MRQRIWNFCSMMRSSSERERTTSASFHSTRLENNDAQDFLWKLWALEGRKVSSRIKSSGR